LSKSHYFWRALAGYALFAILGPGLSATVQALRVPAAVGGSVLDAMHKHATLLAAVAQPMLESREPAALAALTRHYRHDEGFLRHDEGLLPQAASDDDAAQALAEAAQNWRGLYRLTLTDAKGAVLGDSGVNPDGLDNLFNRPEFQLALTRGEGEAQRFSAVLQRTLLYVAVPVGEESESLGFLRLGLDSGYIDARISAERSAIWELALLVMALLMAPAVCLAWRRAAGLEVLAEVTESLAQGDLERRVMESRAPGFKRLADAINLMARNSARRVSALTADRNRLATIFTGMVEGVLDVDQHQNIIHINDAAAALLEVRKENCIGKPVWQELRHQRITQALDEAIRNRGVFRIQVEFPRQRDQRVMDIYIASLSDDQGNPIGAVLVLHDITELKHLERIRTDFVANASHELKTPITAIRGLSETVVGDPNVDKSTLMRFMERIHAQSIRLSQLVSDLMTISRLEADQGTANFARINMNDLISRALMAADAALQQKRHQLHLSLPPTPVQVYGDRQNLNQLVDNLVDNAIKYTPEGGQVWIRLSQDGSDMLLDVQDSGIGISPQYQERVFERFYRVDKARSQSLGGTGLGLSIVRNIAERHGGKVSVRSQPGNGATFSFRMPLAVMVVEN
jgi:two-component system phosphate regulon sensor histidine kinase PhoR